MTTVKTIRARFASTCPGCGCGLDVGDSVGTPTNAPNGSRGVWYCPPCADDFAGLHALGFGLSIPFISEAAVAAFALRCAPYHASLDDRRRENPEWNARRNPTKEG